VLSIGEPLHVAADVDEAGVEEARRRLEAVLLALADRARAIADPGPAAP